MMQCMNSRQGFIKEQIPFVVNNKYKYSLF